LSATARKLKAKMQSLVDFGVPENFKNFLTVELAKPFNYLQFGQDELPEGRQYAIINYIDGSWYEGEVDHYDQLCGRGIMFLRDNNGFSIFEGFWEANN